MSSRSNSASSTSLAGGSVTIERYTVANIDKIMRKLSNAKEISDWGTYLWSHAPFVSFKSTEAVFIQNKPGVWKQISFDVLPIERGGTGVSSMPQNRYLKTDENGNAGFLAREDVIADLGQLRIMTGTYTGTGSARSLELPITPKFIFIYPESGPVEGEQLSGYPICDNSASLANGTTLWELWSVIYHENVRSQRMIVSLSGNKLSFSKDGLTNDVLFCNRSGITYHWTAIY